ncbi:MAG TPA: HAMP domain-containing sensor histidine kinase [Solirubrobacterales bacterium]|nr:HAMP domain-containing sensor histidine kinase [Solirubrobacterales bacterium]
MSGSLKRQAVLTAVAVALAIVALVLAARLMFLTERDALVAAILVLGAGLVALRIATLAARERARAAAEATRRQLVAAVSHDLRTPIASLQLLVEAIDDEIVDEPTRRRYIATMGTHVRSLSAMIDDLFELSRIEAGDIDWSMRQVELAVLVDETVQAMAPEAGAKGVVIHSEIGAEPLAAQADPERIQRVLFNLIRNAIRHTPADGSVTIKAETGRDEVEIEVADTGDGIAEEERERVFDAFFRGGEDAARGSDGAGLGLAVSRAIVETHGGRIWLEPAASGTRVRFSLPRR